MAASTATALRPCPSCGNDQNLAYLWGTRIIQCPRCTLGYVDRLPTMEELNQLYAPEFFKGETSYADYVGEKGGLERNFQMRINQLLKYNRGGELFEAGCAHGFFLNMAKQYWDVKGVDISPEAVDYARTRLGLDASVGDFESHPPEPDTYDAIVMWDTIEHLYDPFLAIQESAKGLKPGGILALTTGDIGALLPRIQRQSWRLIHAAHLYYFSRQSMTYLLEKYGLEVVQFVHEPNYRTLRQYTRVLTYGKMENNWRHNLVHKLDKLPLLNMEIPLNLYDIMFVIARKLTTNH
jgi:2-polyprenyl-3-methyl-5-hydroxy-6-metoxy-1,4-benzoquinol methylase